ncbi:glycoside hydrolase [Daedaleopsis nitida]|nr:glycoside hydrolase [Daedaleopsis nitida]
MDVLKSKRMCRLVPVGIVATCVLWALMHFTVYPGADLSDTHWLYAPPDLHPHGGQGMNPPSPPFRPPPPHGEHTKWSARADAVRDAFLHAYAGYTKYAGSNDELLPVSNGAVNNFNGWRLTLVDSLDTMLVMGLDREFQDAVPIIANMTFELPSDSYVPFFETVIRYLGGILSAYALSGEPILLSRADDLGTMLLPAFDTPHGLPMYAVNTVSGKTRYGWTGSNVLWSEMLSCQMEYKYLAHLTGRKKYFDKVEHIMQLMYDSDRIDSGFPTRWGVTTGQPSNDQFSVGAFADSAHEYLLKQYLLTGQSESKVLDLYVRDVAAIIKNLLYVTSNRKLLYVTDALGGAPTHTFEHLSCFLPGLLALGVHTLALSPRDRQLHEWAARGLAYTCWITYADQPTGLGPDIMSMTGGTKWLDAVEAWERRGGAGGVPPGLAEVPPTADLQQRDYHATAPGYFLRPETVESFYIMWKTTGEEAWRERGWSVFQAIEKETKTPSGYASLQSVASSPGEKKDEMPSFFTAETLKYLYLLFKEEEVISLDRWVFNTEAHPLPVFEWSGWERERYDIVGNRYP